LQKELVESYEARQVKLVPYAEAKEKKFQTDWQTVTIDKPSFTGVRVVDDVKISDLVPYIDWSPFFMAWELKGKYPKIFEDPVVGKEAKELYDNAKKILADIERDGSLTLKAVYGFWPAASDGDEVVLYTDESRKGVLTRLQFLRQQWERKGQNDFRSLADYIAPIQSGRKDYLGAFVVTAGLGADKLAEAFEKQHDDYNSILVKSVADRLAEAFAEMLHARARRDWGYGKEERFSNDELIDECYRGIRPAPGYPACPDHTEKEKLFEILEATKNTGVTLTESFAMWPAASVSGWYFGHPNARYFAVDRLTHDQVEDYARRKGLSLAAMERWLSPNLGYDP
jgi:5-methyltetrahydrofolate--homocysteine methyltransferase